MTTATKKTDSAQDKQAKVYAEIAKACALSSAIRPRLPIDESEVAARLFVKLYDAGGGRTAEHYAQQAIKAAEVFVQTYQELHR